jgi:hypothetical protein
MRTRILYVIAALLWGSVVLAQTPVTVIGSVMPGDCAKFFSQTQISDAGSGCGGAGSPGGSNGQIQYNASGVFGGIATANNGVLVTNGSGGPSLSPTLLLAPPANSTTRGIDITQSS